MNIPRSPASSLALSAMIFSKRRSPTTCCSMSFHITTRDGPNSTATPSPIRIQACPVLRHPRALFQRVHPDERAEQRFEHVPLNAGQDMSITIRQREPGVYEMSPYPFAANFAEFAFAGRFIEPRQGHAGWSAALRETPTV